MQFENENEESYSRKPRSVQKRVEEFPDLNFDICSRPFARGLGRGRSLGKLPYGQIHGGLPP